MGPLWGRCRKHHYTHPKHQPRDIYIAWENGSNSQFLLVVDGGWGVCVGGGGMGFPLCFALFICKKNTLVLEQSLQRKAGV